MSRLRHYLVPTLLLLPVILICGKLLLTPVWREETIADVERAGGGTIPMGSGSVGQMGWPWVFLETANLIEWGTDWGKRLLFSWWLLAADAAILLAVIAAVTAVFLWHRRRRGRWLRFSLRELFLLVALAAIAPTWWAQENVRSQNEHQVVEQLSTMGVYCQINYTGPDWVRRLYPAVFDEPVFCHRATWVDLSAPVASEDANHMLSLLGQLRHVRLLAIRADVVEPATPEGGEKVAPLISPSRKVDWSWLNTVERVEMGAAGDDGTLQVLSALPQLRNLYISKCPISDRGLSYLANCRTLEFLNLNGANVTDAGVAHLVNLTRLTRLDLTGTQITDTAIDTLLNLKSLTQLYVNCEHLTDRGVRRLLELPKLYVLYYPDQSVSDETKRLIDTFTLERANRRIEELHQDN